MATIVVADRAPQRLRVHGPGWGALFRGLRHPIRFLRELIYRVQETRASTQAAAMTYYFFLSLFPLVLFVLAFVSVLPVRGLEDWLLGYAAQVVPGEAYGMLSKVIQGLLAQKRSGLLSLGAVLALWAASSAFLSVIDGLDQAYGVVESRPWWRLRLEAMGLVVALSAFMIVGFVLTVFGGPLVLWLGQWLGPAGVLVLLVARWVVVIGVITMVVAAIYYACPDVEQDWHWITPGSLVFTVGFGATSAAFSYYVSHFGSYDATYGSLGAVIILLAWMYMLAFFLLLGGQVNGLLERLTTLAAPPQQAATPAPSEDRARA